MKETKLPNGLRIFCIRKSEVKFVYNELKAYLRNGIQLKEGHTVFDVGANIGLFSLWVYNKCKKNVTIYAFEPIPEVFNVLQLNAQRIAPNDIKVFPIALSNESNYKTFAYRYNATIMSTAYILESKKERAKFKEVIVRNLKNVSPISRRIPSFLISFIIGFYSGRSYKKKQVTCQTKTISDIVNSNNVNQIDLLKIDVEKSELDVLLGIVEKDWQKIKQIVVEVHNLNNRLDQIKMLLKKHNFDEITVEQLPIFRGSNLFNLYALKKNTQ